MNKFKTKGAGRQMTSDQFSLQLSLWDRNLKGKRTKISQILFKVIEGKGRYK
jgi:hypothetical protein